MEQLKFAKSRLGTDKKEKVFRWEASSSSRLTRRFNTICNEAGCRINNQSFHRLRNTFSNKILDSDMTAVEMRRAMRHSNIQTTIEKYEKRKKEKMGEKIQSVVTIDKSWKNSQKQNNK